MIPSIWRISSLALVLLGGLLRATPLALGNEGKLSPLHLFQTPSKQAVIPPELKDNPPASPSTPQQSEPVDQGPKTKKDAKKVDESSDSSENEALRSMMFTQEEMEQLKKMLAITNIPSLTRRGTLEATPFIPPQDIEPAPVPEGSIENKRHNSNILNLDEAPIVPETNDPIDPQTSKSEPTTEQKAEPAPTPPLPSVSQASLESWSCSLDLLLYYSPTRWWIRINGITRRSNPGGEMVFVTEDPSLRSAGIDQSLRLIRVQKDRVILRWHTPWLPQLFNGQPIPKHPLMRWIPETSMLELTLLPYRPLSLTELWEK
jgi:hypothetical protein